MLESIHTTPMSSDRLAIVIPARKGSKALEGKNTYPLNHRPLIQYTFDSTNIKPKHDIIVTTDCPFVKAETEAYFGERQLKYVLDERPYELANDKATLDQVMVYISNKFDYNIYICLQPNSPLRTHTHLYQAVKLFQESNAQSLISVQSNTRSLWKKREGSEFVEPLIERLKNRQLEKPIYQGNGGIYITHRDILQKYGSRTGGRTIVFEMDEMSSLDVHTRKDIELAEFWMLQRDKEDIP